MKCVAVSLLLAAVIGTVDCGFNLTALLFINYENVADNKTTNQPTETTVEPPRKPYRDYTYSERADAYYKLFSKKADFDEARNNCGRDFAELISVDPDDLMMATKLLNDSNYKLFVNDNDGGCQYVNGAGIVNSIDCSEELDNHVCKVNASKLKYDERCKMYYGTDEPLFTPKELLGSCYYHSTHTALVKNAEAECERYGSHLAVINSPDEAAFIQQLTKKHIEGFTHDETYPYHVTLGFQYSHLENGQRIFKSVLGRTLEEEGYDTWAPGQPNNYNGLTENCGSWAHYRPGLNDVSCYRKLIFICEKEMYCDCCTPKCLSA